MKSIKKYKKGGKKFPDLNGDGKVTMADVLKGRGVKKAGKGMKYGNGGELTPMKKKKAGQEHRDGARMVGNYKKGAADPRKEFKRVSDAEQHRQTSGSKPGKPRLAQELSSSRR
jgi:hypothetical protein